MTMRSLREYIGNGDNKIRRITVLTIYATAALTILVMAALLVTLSVTHRDDTPNVIGGGKGEFTLTYEDTKKGDLLVINKNSTAFDFALNSESRLVAMAEDIPAADGTPLYTLRNADMKASSAAISALNKMVEDFYAQAENKAAATRLYIWSSYRSLDAQNALGTSTKGGHSDFHTGNLFEITYGGSAASISEDNTYDWLYKNAYKYGFIDRYHATKSSITGVSGFDNAFRYVGIPHAAYMTENNLCLEEYVEKVRSYTKDDPLEITVGNTTYEVYYVNANAEGETVIKTSSKNGTSISGDNAGGFIVTVRK